MADTTDITVQPYRAVLSLGSNLGDRAATLRAGVQRIADKPAIRVDSCSRLYESAPIGCPPGSGRFYNIALAVTARIHPYALLAECQDVENAMGRTRTVLNGPRTLDIDIVTASKYCCDDPTLTLPHPRCHQRLFVLLPWLDLEPDAEVLGHGPVAKLIQRLDPSVTQLCDDFDLALGPLSVRQSSESD